MDMSTGQCDADNLSLKFSIRLIEKLSMVSHTWEAKAGGSEVQGYLIYFSTLKPAYATLDPAYPPSTDTKFNGKQGSQEVGILNA